VGTAETISPLGARQLTGHAVIGQIAPSSSPSHPMALLFLLFLHETGAPDDSLCRLPPGSEPLQYLFSDLVEKFMKRLLGTISTDVPYPAWLRADWLCSARARLSRAPKWLCCGYKIMALLLPVKGSTVLHHYHLPT